MDKSAYLTRIDDDGRAALAAVASAPDARVAACPDWSNAELGGHLGMVWGYVTTQVQACDPSGSTRPESDPTASGTSLLAGLLEALAETDDGSPAWNWTPQLTAGFWVRRMAHETAIHRWDAEDAAGGASPIHDDLAPDTVQEAIDVALQFHRSGPIASWPDGSLHLHRTDGPGEWLLLPGDDGLTVTLEHAKGDAAMAGSASDLALWLWGRGRGDLRSWGDEALLDAWSSVAP